MKIGETEKNRKVKKRERKTEKNEKKIIGQGKI